MGYTSIDEDGSGILLGVFFGVTLGITAVFLDRVQGKAYRIQDFLAAREWHLFQSETVISRINKVLLVCCWIFFTIPPITLIFWGSGVIARRADFNQNTAGGIGIFLFGFSIMFFLYGAFKIKWDRFRVSSVSAISIGISLLFLTTYQVTMTFMIEDDSFFGLSSIFLTANAVLMIIITFMNSGRIGTSVGEVIAMLPEGEELDNNRQNNFDDEITEAYKQDDYVPTRNEIFEMFTINRVSKKRQLIGVLEGGIIHIFASMSKRSRVIMSLCIYIVALLILGAYALLDYLVRNDSKLGIITMCAVIASDVLLYLYGHSEIVTSPAEISLHIVLFRICLFVLGGQYWIYGYSLLYLYFGCYLAFHIAKLRFPFMDEIINRELDDLDVSEENKNKFNIAKTPEFIFTLATGLFVILLALMEITKPDDVPLKDYEIRTETLGFYVYGTFAILAVFTFFFAIIVARIFRRKRNGIDGKIYFYVHWKNVDLFWFGLLILYGLIAITANILYFITDDTRYLIVGLLAPLAIILLINSYLKFALNDFMYTQDVKNINRYILKHNAKIDEVKSKIREFKEEVAEQSGTKMGLQDLTPAQIQELSKKKLHYKKNTKTEEEGLLEQKAKENKVKPKESPRAESLDREENKNDQEEQKEEPQENKDEEEEEVYPDEEIEEGGSDEENKEVGWNSSHNNKTQEEMRRGLFKKDTTLRKDNKFGQIARLLIKDEAVEYDPSFSNMSKAPTKYKLVDNWKKDTNVIAAFFTGRLRSNDYHIYLSFFGAVVIFILLGLAISLDKDSTEGVSWTIGFLYFFITVAVLVKPIQTDAEMHIGEAVLYAIIFVIYFAWGLADFQFRFDFDPDKKPDEYHDGDHWLVWYPFFFPFAVLLLSGIYKWYDKSWQFGPYVICSFVFSGIFGIVTVVLCFVYIGPVSGVIFSCLIASILYTVIMAYIYVKNGHYLPRYLIIVNVIVLSCVAIVTFIVSLAVDDFNVFLGWSITYAIFVGLIFMYGAIKLMKDLKRSSEEPIYFSPWIFPIFKYYPKKNDIQMRNTPCALVLLSLFLAVLWSFQCSIWVTPITTGIAVCCLTESLFIIFVLYIVSFTPALLEEIRDNIDNLLVKQAWLEAKEDYVKTKNIHTPSSMITYEECVMKKNGITKHMKNLRNGDKEARDVRIAHEWNTKGIDTTSLFECRKYLYEVEQENTLVYLDELSILIHFEILLILYANNLAKKDRKFLFKFLEVKKHALAATDINIVIPPKGKPQYKHAKVLTQISRLSAEKEVLFKRLKEDFVQEEREKEDQIREQERIEEEKEREREEALAKMTEDKRKLLENIDPDMPIDEMPDCQLKYEKIVERYKNDKTMFTDTQFTADEKALGPGCLNRGVAKWMRTTDIPGTSVYKDNTDARDVVQGALGDCYFLSAMSVLGDKHIRNCIKTIDPTDEDEINCGAFWVRFYKYGNEEDVIIDNFFPVLGNDQFAFVRGGPDGKELWPMILEKAYAKMNGSYNNIEAGKVQMALADMTGGVSEQIDLKSVATNLTSFWERLKSLVSQGALMGAGSPENPLGDSAINEFGVVQGHAYAVLGICEVDNYKLINLRNPHGGHGVEWNGDWSDDSDMWTQRAKNKCKFEDCADGVFWMDLDDFIENFSYLYVCRIMKDWKCIEIEDEWKGESAEGLPSRNNKNAKLELNPQFELRMNSPGPIFIQMTQFDKVNMFKGKHFIMYLLQKSTGGRLSRMDRKAILGMSGKPTNLNIVSSEIELTSQHTFPLVITLMAANTANGPAGEGKFEVKVFSMNNFTFKKI